MGKKITTTSGTLPNLPRYKSYSIDEILAAGGTTAFANSLGKDPAKIAANLKGLPKDAFLTKDEATKALELLKENE